MQQTVTVNETQSSNGVSVTLEKIVFSETKTDIYLMLNPPYPHLLGNMKGDPLDIRGHYRFDNGPLLNTSQFVYDAQPTSSVR